ncbi:uncharacterized protein GGS22DRAFT_43616 [Annulohypoxylon maeteangense]|uniref:uncharacterized protein n=1 Tax=Annulohypoxylon maeteangense TaxID=1927788 RepID=UPI0020083804|nr:uncharacterized protein GGS22DRAFT_43616 [Annulohypoxylon maeteangense]KAI0882410.1 hypothetical protein GGS22DRAFT_43616 [Annulohypoxylon maeteangense]
MTGRHFHQARGHGHGHGHHHFHSRELHIETEQPVQLETREAMAEHGSVWADTISRIVPRENNLDEKPVGSTTTLPIILGVCIPLGLAIIVLVYLHHRTTVRQRREDETDKYKSMDFGFEGNVTGKKNKRQSYFGKEKDPNHKVQLSMDMNLSSPYLLPPALHQSRESMNSLAKSLHQDDPYRPVTSYGGSDVASMRSFNKGLDRDSTVSSGKARSSGDRDPFRNPPPPRRGPSPLQQLPPVAQPPSRRASGDEVSAPPAKNEFRFTDDNITLPGVPEIQEPPVAASQGPHNARPLSNESTNANNANVVGPANAIDARVSQSSADLSGARPPRKESLPAGLDIAQDYQNYAGHFQIDGPDNEVAREEVRMPHMPDEHEYPHSAGLGVPGQDNRRLSVGFRPLPPEDFLESEDPEFRANRIRSFYKEYFEEIKTDNGKPPPLPQQPAYHEDYDANYLGDTAFFDPETNAFVMPYAQPVTRRAMTPPPSNRRPMPGPGSRGPPGPRGPHGHGPHGSMNMPGPRRPRAGSTMSASRWAAMSPRPDSSASNPRNFNNGKPRKPMPPPAALNTLPTPSKLRDDSMALLGSIDFAPPPTFKDVVAGRSQSPVGERKPYMLTTPIHSPLVSAFDDTPALPSPHLLRKSGTFTGLDFAPPRRFKDPESMSETGSVVSNRSGISSANLSAIRAGAGRVSRLPGDTVFTQAAMTDNLKPSWNMRT